MLTWSCYEGAAGSVVGSMVGGPVNRLGLVWILSGSLVDGIAFSTLFSRMLLGQGLTSVSILGLQTVGLLPDVQMNEVPSRSLGGLLSGH